MLRKYLVALSVALAITGCGEKSKIEKAVGQVLKDPGSAQFKDMIVSADGKNGCITWNAKNGFGGYGEWNVALLKKNNDEWAVKEIETSSLNCSQKGFDAIDAELDARKNAVEESIKTLAKVRGVTREVASALVLNGECKDLVEGVAYYAGQVRFDEVNGIGVMLGYEREKLKSYQSVVESGGCKTPRN